MLLQDRTQCCVVSARFVRMMPLWFLIMLTLRRGGLPTQVQAATPSPSISTYPTRTFTPTSTEAPTKSNYPTVTPQPTQHNNNDNKRTPAPTPRASRPPGANGNATNATVAPTRVPTVSPANATATLAPTAEKETYFISNITIRFTAVTGLNGNNVETWENLTALMFINFYGAKNVNYSIANFWTKITVVNQNIQSTQDNATSLTVTYDQLMRYQVTGNASRAEVYAQMPFTVEKNNAAYGLSLRSALSGWSKLVIPVDVPRIPGLAPPSTPAPSAAPTDEGTASAAPSDAPSHVPTATPSAPAPAMAVDDLISGITIRFDYVGRLQRAEVAQWEDITEKWFSGYYAQAQAERRRQLQVDDRSFVQNMTTDITFVKQDVGDGYNIITYDQSLSYIALDGALTSQVYAILPFQDKDSNTEYGTELRNFVNFKSLKIPVNTPDVTGSNENATEAPSSPPPTPPATEPPSTAPTLTPTPKPVPQGPGTAVDDSFTGIKIRFDYVGRLRRDEVKQWENITEKWFSGFYLEAQAERRRHLQADERTFVQDMTTDITFVQQDPGDGFNIITYDQKLSYVALDGALTSQEYASLPFEDGTANAEYGKQLRKFINFKSLKIPVDRPDVPDPDNGADAITGEKKDSFFTKNVIIGIAAGGAAILLVLVCLCYRSMSKDGGYRDATSPPPVFNISADEDVSTIEEPLAKQMSDPEPLLLEGGYGDQSVATVDYDYSKAYGGGDTSVVSSAGGTMGDTTRQTGDVVAGSSALAALGAESQFRESEGGTREEIIEILAPAGKLGVVIDTPDEGAPVVHAVKDSSVIADQIQVGDKLIAVDDEDVRSMTAIKVSKLISKKSANPTRKLTIIRTTLVDDPEG